MKIKDADNIEKIPVDMEGAVGAWKQLAISREDGSPNFSFRVFTIEPGGNTPFHSHESEHLNYVIDGEGVLVDKENNDHPISKGSFMLVLPNEKHQYKNTSCSKDMVLICAVPSKYE